MCGIVGYVGNRQACDVLIDGLSKLEYRGYDSAGIAVIEDGVIRVEKRQGRLENLINKLKEEGIPSGTVGIGHTRWATHGEPSDINSHPHGNKRVTIVHNGIIENYREIKEFLISEGYSFVSETDTETVAKLLDYYMSDDPVATIAKVITEIRGSYSLGIMFRDFPDRIYAVRKESPLIVGLSEDGNFIASDVPAIIRYTRDYYLLEENEIAELFSDRVRVYDVHGNKIKKVRQTADWDVDSAEKGGFEHFMLKEIHEQPTSVKMTITPRIKDGMPDFSAEGLTEEMLRGFKNIHIVACGTAMHAGMVGKYVIESLARTPVIVDIASEFRYRDPLITKDDLVILISQSGETADTRAALELSKELGAFTMAVVNVKGSSIAREADMVVYTHAGPEISVASTKAYSVQVAIMYLFAFELAFVRGSITREQCMDYVQKLADMPGIMEKAIELKERCQYASSRLLNADSLLYIGRGLDYALSMEGSLKLKEISYIHSESYAAGELKHGTISLITQDMPVIAVATQTRLIEKTVSNIKEVKSRGAMVVLICSSEAVVEENIADYIIRLPEADELLMPLAAAVPLQLIAYYTAVLKGCDVDKPRNLAKSVTVE
ncbi:MAG TPA: glutamine--fructose-6-phosphate transaminase (isomerizing) [Lachnospiraceae bacterium]|nr:glutamine--fructose-6-phosphate transaminase (isomerizing) [Lachnospiraceae bacterium]